MKRLRISSYVLCAILVACTSPVLAGSIIDESFDALGDIPQAMAMHVADLAFADTWFSLGQGGPVWMAGMSEAMFNSSTAPMDMYTTLVYFSAKPVGGWGGAGVPLELSFQYHATADDLLTFGVYGWLFGAEIPTGSAPGSNGVPLIEGLLPAAPALTPVVGGFGGDLSRFDFIGATFTVAGSSNDAGFVVLDDVHLVVVPEPASIVLAVTGFAALAGMRRRRRRRRQAGKT